MAERITLPPRANALTFDTAEVADVLLAVYSTPPGEGIVVAAGQDSEPKARSRARNMAKELAKGVTVKLSDLDDDDTRAALIDYVTGAEGFDGDDDELLSAFLTAGGFSGDDDAPEDAEDVPVPIAPATVRTHAVPRDDLFLPVVALKPAKD